MKNILVTIEFNRNEQLLIDKASELAKSFGSKVWIMHIAPPDPDFVGYRVGPQYIRDSVGKDIRKEHRVLQEYATKLKKEGINAEGILIQGATIKMIIDESKKLNIDLIIAGHHEHGFIYNSFVGSVSAEIIKASKIPVLIVPL
jgi:nucleotide-binding universal stress UspA family protein